MSSQAASKPNVTKGEFSFISSASTSSLFRNDQVMIKRDGKGNTESSEGINLDKFTLDVHDARMMGENQPTCEKNGFELLYAPLADDGIDLRHHENVVKQYYGQCERLVAGVTGALAFAFDHNVRSATGKQGGDQVSGGQDVQGPAHLVHGDYTLRSGPERLAQLANPPSGNDTLKGFLAKDESLIPAGLVQDVIQQNRRFSIINVWRNIVDTPVVTHPMALCDAQTVTPEELVVFEIHYSDRIGENYFSKYSPQHAMYFYPKMTRDEALLIKQWDSGGTLAQSKGAKPDSAMPEAPCTFSFHSAFVDPDVPLDAPDRWSMEIRCMVIYD